MTHFFTHHGLPLLFVVVMLESFGLPLPGETALVAFAILASQGHYDSGWVIGPSSCMIFSSLPMISRRASTSSVPSALERS